MTDDPIRFFACDSTEGMLALPAESVDVVVVSPPYNIGTDYGNTRDDAPRQQYLIDMATWGLAVRRLLKPAGSLFLNISGKPVDPWIAFDVAHALRGTLVLQNTVHWIKSIAIDERTHGHFKPINSRRFLNQCHEYLFHFTRSGDVPLDRAALGVPYTDVSNLRRWDRAEQDQVHCRGNCWHLPYETRQASGLHPATFPPGLPDYCLRLHGLPADGQRDDYLACDPFCGTGASALAAARHGLAFVGFDTNPDYLREAGRRLQQEGFGPASITLGLPGEGGER